MNNGRQGRLGRREAEAGSLCGPNSSGPASLAGPMKQVPTNWEIPGTEPLSQES